MEPNYSNMGMASVMGKPLKKYIEKQLIKDLFFYDCVFKEYKFDWSDSCIEGKCIRYLGGSTDIYSSIKVYDENDNFVLEGWMEFIYDSENDNLIVYWDLLDVMSDGKLVRKKNFGIPNHIYEQLSPNALLEVKKYKMNRI